MRRWSGHAGCVLLCVAFGLACTPESTPTQLLVVVDSDLALDSDGIDALSTVEVTVLSANREAQLLPPRQFAVRANPQRSSEYRVPFSFALTPLESAESSPFASW